MLNLRSVSFLLLKASWLYSPVMLNVDRAILLYAAILAMTLCGYKNVRRPPTHLHGLLIGMM